MIFTQLRIALLGSVVALAVGFGGGWRLRDKLCDAAMNEAQIDWLQRQLDAHQEAARVNNEMHDQHEKELSELQEIINGHAGKISDGVCFTADDVERVRELWPGAK